MQNKQLSSWSLFSRKKFMSAINKCSNSSVSDSNRILWKHLKSIVKNNECLENIVNIANGFIVLCYWSIHFKLSSSIIIPKSNKASYDFSKSFYPIILLNMLEKLIEKVIGKHLQFQLIVNNFVHLNQLGGLKQWLITNADIFLTYLIYSGWVKNLQISTLSFNITQFFPSLNH